MTRYARPEWSIQELAKASGTTSRALRHYDEIGLLPPTRIGSNGYRYYDEEALLRLQRILLLRDLGLGLPLIADVLRGQQDTVSALSIHLRYLEEERSRIGRQIASVKSTISKTQGGEPLVADQVFDGFDHTQYKDEVIDRWGKEAYERSDRWWRGMTEEQKKGFGQTHLDIAADYGKAHAAGLSIESDEVQAIVKRHYAWIMAGWQGSRPSAEQFTGLGEMYVADDRFRANYDVHGAQTAEYVRDAMVAYALKELVD